MVIFILGRLSAKEDEFCWNIFRIKWLEHWPYSLSLGICHKLKPRIAAFVPQDPTSRVVEIDFGKFVSKGELEIKQIMGLIASNFPDHVTSKIKFRSVTYKFQRKTTKLNCRSLLERLVLEQRAEPSLYVEYKRNDDNEVVRILWITVDQRFFLFLIHSSSFTTPPRTT